MINIILIKDLQVKTLLAAVSFTNPLLLVFAFSLRLFRKIQGTLPTSNTYFPVSSCLLLLMAAYVEFSSYKNIFFISFIAF